ncbi:MAG TPA: alpha-glucan family phosphorylase [Candidatus Kapabacteria bacterium]|nr:alpha-glucan family phosphorylase [Candidatus Kapabacteria bacterium]
MTQNGLGQQGHHSNEERELPRSLARLDEIAHNLWWSWSPEARDVFRTISVGLWRRTEHNPVRMLRDVTQARLDKLANDEAFLARYHTLLTTFDKELTQPSRVISKAFPNFEGRKVAYFSAEYGLHTSLPIYSGGLGVLAGDHVKTASDIGLDLTAIGFMYPRGYFEQRINSDGMQQANYERISIENSPIERAYLTSGEPSIVSLALEQPDDLLHLQVWLVRAGRVKMYLIDSDLDLNKPWNREISTRLYGGDQEYRLRQEIALGIGGVRVLRTMGVEPDVWHANEGHVAFMLLERVREAVQQKGMSFGEACEFVKRTTAFTTHTPVPAGHDAFPFQLIERYFWHYWPQLGAEKEQFLQLGRHQEPWGEAFNMTVLSLNLSTYRNAVSKKHEVVTREMWPEHVSHGQNMRAVTNGVHVPTWIAPEMSQLFRDELAPDWVERQCEQELWDKVMNIPDQKLWEVRDKQKKGLITFILTQIRNKWQREGMDPSLFVPSGALLDPSILTIGFARRFATYKRATLIFHELERLKKLLTDPIRPIQIVFSGKAHPADEGGKRLIQTIYEFAKDPAFAGRIAFIENYSMHVAKNLVRGVDLWMNNPKAPLEASGTSGMKAGINGVPNFSILDGWWIEGWNGKNGWGIEGAEEGTPEIQDIHDVAAMYDLLEKEIIPLYYDKGSDGIPHGWLQVMKESIRTIIPQFSSERMVREYVENIYMPAAKAGVSETITA